MMSLILWWTIGVVVRFILIALSPAFNFRSSAIKAGAAIVIGSVAAYFATQANMSHWIFYAIFCVAGFLTKYIIEKLSSIKG